MHVFDFVVGWYRIFVEIYWKLKGKNHSSLNDYDERYFLWHLKGKKSQVIQNMYEKISRSQYPTIIYHTMTLFLLIQDDELNVKKLNIMWVLFRFLGDPKVKEKELFYIKRSWELSFVFRRNNFWFHKCHIQRFT